MLLQIVWKDRDGNEKFANTPALDVSGTGMRVENAGTGRRALVRNRARAQVRLTRHGLRAKL